MAEQLKIEIDVAQARKALESLGGSFNTFKQAANNATSGASEAIKRLNSAMSKIKAIDPGVLNSLNAVNTALTGLQSGNLSTLTNTLNQLGGSAAGVQATAAALQNAQQALANFQAPQGIDTVTVRFGNMANAANRLTPAQRAAQQAANAHARAINDLGTELLNAGGFMAGIGVTAGRMAQSFSTLAQNGTSLRAIFAELSARFGEFGASMIAVTAGVVVFKGLYTAVSSVIQPIFEVGTKMQVFKNVLDSIDGDGAGAKAFDSLKETALNTGLSIDVLTDNFKGFRAAAQASGMEAGESMKIYTQFSTAFGAIGLNAQKTEKAFNAFTQMLSKGKVQAEELRGQLGDALPGAFVYAAQSMGVTTAALDGMLRAGMVLPEELLPALGQFLQNKFGDAVAKQAQSAAGQLTNLGTRVSELLMIMAQGNFGGVLGGLAEGFRRLNNALDSEAFRALAAVIGDFIGILANTVLSTLGSVINGFTFFFDLIGKGINYFSDLLAPIRSVTEYLRENNGVMRALGGAIDFVGNALGAAIAVWLVFGGGIRAATLASSLAVGMFRSMASTVTTLIPAVGGLNTVLAGYIAGLRGVQAAQTAQTASTLAAQVALIKQNGVMNTLKSAVSGLSAMISGGFIAAWRALQVVGTSVLSVFAAVGRGFASFILLGGGVGAAIGVLIAILYRFYEPFQRVVDKTWEWAKALMGISGPGNSAKAATEAVSQALTKLLDTASRAPQKIADMALEFQTFKGATAAAGQEMEALDLQIAANTQMYGDNKEALEELNKPLEDKKKLLKEFGVELDSSQIKLAAQASSLGMSKDAAINLAQQMKVLTQSETDRAAALEEQITKGREYADFLTEQMDKLKQKLELDKRAVEEGRMSAQSAEFNRKGIEALTESLAGQRVEAVTTLAAQEGLRNSMISGQDLFQSTADAAKNLGEAYGGSVDATEALKRVGEMVNPTLDATKTASQKAAEEQKKLGENATKTSEEVTKAKISLEQTKTAVETMSTSLTTAQTSLDTARTSFESINTAAGGFSTSVTTLSTNMPVLNEAMTAFGGTITGMSETLPQFATDFNAFTTSTGTLMSSLPGVNEQVVALNTNFLALLPSAQQIAGVFDSIGAAATSLEAAQTNLTAFMEQMTNSMATLDSFKSALDQIADAAGVTIVAGFDAAMVKGDSFITKLSDIGVAVGNLITAMGDLKAAAEAALAAAAKAQAAAGNTDANVNQNREGGYSDVASRQRQTVDLSAFDNAPQFKEGTTNTSKFLSKVAGGGIPSILHPNEAVVPLSRGRKIPVDLTMAQIKPPAQRADTAPDLTPMTDTAKAMNSLTGALDRIATALQRPALDSPYSETKAVQPVINVLPPKIPEWKAIEPVAPKMADRQSSNGLEPPSVRNQKDSGSDSAPVNQPTAPISITINVKTDDVDGFRRSKDQIARELSEKIRRANRRNG